MGLNKNTLGVIGLAKRAGKLVQGAESVVDMIRAGKAKLVILACDPSDNTKKLIRDKAGFYSVRIEESDIGMAELGKAIGKKSAAAVAITDVNFVNAYDSSLLSGDAATKERGV